MSAVIDSKMTTSIEIITSIIVGSVALVGAIVTMLRALLHLGVWIDALTKNTKATVELTGQLSEISNKVSHLSDRVDALERRIEVH